MSRLFLDLTEAAVGQVVAVMLPPTGGGLFTADSGDLLASVLMSVFTARTEEESLILLFPDCGDGCPLSIIVLPPSRLLTRLWLLDDGRLK